MPSRRSVLAFLGLAPVAAPAALATLPVRPIAIAGADVTAHGVTVAPAVTPAPSKAGLKPRPEDLRAMRVAMERSQAELVQFLSSEQAEVHQ